MNAIRYVAAGGAIYGGFFGFFSAVFAAAHPVAVNAPAKPVIQFVLAML
ncbi:hypothetical protein [Prosthecomicrobium sp. N25]